MLLSLFLSKKCRILTLYRYVVFIFIILHLTNAVEKADKANGLLAEDMTFSGPSLRNDVLLTPWWDLDFGKGERVSISCGYNTVDEHGRYSMTWLKDQQPLSTSNQRTHISVLDEEGESSYLLKKKLTIDNLKLSDSGSYSCAVTDKQTNSSRQESINIRVLDGVQITGFEYENDTRWSFRAAANQTINWMRFQSLELDGHMLIYDHTYGSASTPGSFLGLESSEIETKAIIVSQILNSTESEQCLHFWYAFEGPDTKSLHVYILQDSDSIADTLDSPTLALLNSSSSLWNHAFVSVPPQEKSYKVLITGSVCTGTTCTGTNLVAIDDIKITQSSCEVEEHHQCLNGNLRLRLSGSHNNEGFLEIVHDAEHKTVCESSFSELDVAVACSQLGFSDGNDQVILRKDVNDSRNTNDLQKIWPNKISCSGTETNIGQCLMYVLQATQCTHDRDVYLICSSDVSPSTLLSSTQATHVGSSTSVSTSRSTQSTVYTSPNSGPQPWARYLSSNNPSNMSSTAASAVTVPSTTRTSLQSTSPSVPSSLSSTATTSIPTHSASPTGSQTSSHTQSHSVTPHVTNPETSTTGVHIDGLASTTIGVSHYSNNPGVGKGIAIFFTVVVLIAVAVFGFIMYKGRKRRRRKSKYSNFGTYSTDQLPTNEFHMECPLTMGSMGYTVLA